MKRLIKLLSIFGVLIILGSCSSSKSVNVSTITGVKQYIKFKSLNSTSYPIKSIKITSSDGTYTSKTFFVGDEMEVLTDTSYTVIWKYEDVSAGSSDYITITKTDVEFSFNDSTILVALGTTPSQFYEIDY